jgi:hypothetical protein
MVAIITSPTVNPEGLSTVTEAVVLVALVAVPRCAICAKTFVLTSANPSSSIAFEITLETKEEGRNVPMSLKKLVFSSNIGRKNTSTHRTKTTINEKLILFGRLDAWLSRGV